MKGPIALSILVGISSTAFAETIGSAGGGSFIFGGSAAEAPLRPSAPVPAPQIPQPNPETISVPPSPSPQPSNIAPTPPASGAIPFQASIAIGSTRCPDPIAHPNARNTPVKVFVDQQTQTIQIITPDRPNPVQSRVSTGGGLKIPSKKSQKQPYCARTPGEDRLVISAVTPEMFEGTGCTPKEIRAKSTVFPMYYSGTFTDKHDRPVPMPFAIRISGGIFFHEVPPSYREMLGHNVSGECVRLTPSVAKLLQAQIKKYGAIEVTMTEAPQVPRGMGQYCDQQMVADAIRERATGVSAAPRVTGTEGIYGGEENFFTLIDRFFNPHRQATRPRPPRPRRI